MTVTKITKKNSTEYRIGGVLVAMAWIYDAWTWGVSFKTKHIGDGDNKDYCCDVPQETCTTRPKAEALAEKKANAFLKALMKEPK